VDETEMALRIASAGFTDVGAQRSHNEDAILLDAERGFYVICDGMGGHASGAVASQTAVAAIAEAMRTGTPKPPPGEEPLVTAVLYANAQVYARSLSDPQCRGMGTTVVAVRQEGDSVHLCHVGDSRIYLLRDGILAQLTRDHSLINLYADNPDLAGKLGPAHSNIIVRAVGLHEYVEVDHAPVAMAPGDVYLLCCDGLTDMVPDEGIRQIMTAGDDLPVTGVKLVSAANAAGGADNISVILLKAEQS
jgi:serine/threonine protein phosphatase PrpC